MGGHHSASSTPRAGRVNDIRRVILLTLALNLLVAVAKATYGVLSGALAVTSDAIHSMLDASSNILGYATVGMAAQPPDEGHPYGHGKVEIVGALFLGALIGAGALSFGYSAVAALITGRNAPSVGAGGFVVVGGTLLVNIFVAWWEARKGRELDSPFLKADAAHTASDVATTVGVLASMGLTAAGYAWADPVGALLVLLVIARVAWHIIGENIAILLDSAAVDADAVVAIAVAVPGVLGCHRVRSRGLPSAAHLDLHLQVPGGMSLRQAHALSHRVADRLKAELPGLVDVTIHMEPEDDPEETL